MKTKDIVIGLVVLVLLILGALWVRKIRKDRTPTLVDTTPTVEERVTNSFGNFNIPNDVEKKELKDVSGGNGFGIATENMVLADLSDPDSGYFYQVWLEKDGTLLSLGKMRMAKGGWILEKNIGGYSGYQKVFVSRERVFDNTLEAKLLEGSL